jgi:hypothetical protein
VTAAQPIFHVLRFGVNVIVFENVTLPVVVMLLLIVSVPVYPVQLMMVQAEATSMLTFPEFASRKAVSPAIGWALVAGPPEDSDQVELFTDQLPPIPLA